jgi:hypothetical protein
MRFVARAFPYVSTPLHPKNTHLSAHAHDTTSPPDPTISLTRIEKIYKKIIKKMLIDITQPGYHYTEPKAGSV